MPTTVKTIQETAEESEENAELANPTIKEAMRNFDTTTFFNLAWEEIKNFDEYKTIKK